MAERAVVFKTPGILDMRALTIFGMNAKPSTNTPIGFFGTGLKYAVAVLARERLPITIYTNDVKWEVKVNETNFRGKEFHTLQLIRHKKWLGTATRDLPYTTEHGKTWKLWQAFRELYSNTLDEDGEAYIRYTHEIDHSSGWFDPKFTYIIIEGEKFVKEYLEREKTFLPDALRAQQTNTAPVQVFERPSDCVYYRGIRIMDFPAGEKSQFTYNVLKQIDLTEDRTAKYPFEVYAAIEEYVQHTTNTEHIKAIVKPQEKTIERKFTYDYGHYRAPSKQFIETVLAAKEEGGTPPVLSAVMTRVRSYLPPEPKVEDKWLTELVDLLEFQPDPILTDMIDEAKKQFADKVWEEKERMLKILRAQQTEIPF